MDLQLRGRRALVTGSTLGIGFAAAKQLAMQTGSLAPPKHILNAPTKLMKDLGYGAGYSYDHDAPDGFSGDNYWPDGMAPVDFYRPVDRGFEKRIAERIAWWDERRRLKE